MQLKHPHRKGPITIAYHAGSTIKPKVLLSVLEEAGLTVDDLGRLL